MAELGRKGKKWDGFGVWGDGPAAGGHSELGGTVWMADEAKEGTKWTEDR